MRLIDADVLLECFEKKGVQIIFDLPVEEVLGEDIDLDDFAMLVQDAVQAYKGMVIDIIENQPTAYDAEKVDKQIVEYFKNQIENDADGWKVVEFSHDIRKIVRNGGKE